MPCYITEHFLQTRAPSWYIYRVIWQILLSWVVTSGRMCILHLVVRRSHSPAKIYNLQDDFGKEIYVHTPKQADMEFVQNFTPLDFQVKNFTPSISANFNSFSKKKHKKLVKMEKFTPLAKILHCRRHWRDGQIPPLPLPKLSVAYICCQRCQ